MFGLNDLEKVILFYICCLIALGVSIGVGVTLFIWWLI